VSWQFPNGKSAWNTGGGLLKLGNMMADEEIERLSGEKDLLAKLEVAREAEYSSRKRWRCITQFLNLCADGSRVLNFDKSLEDVNAIIAKASSTSNYGRPEQRGFQSSDTERAVVSLLEEYISWKIHLRSPYQTKLNAFKVLTRIGHAILQAQKGPYADSLKNITRDYHHPYNAEDLRFYEPRFCYVFIRILSYLAEICVGYS
jgi:hypothetical protein